MSEVGATTTSSQVVYADVLLHVKGENSEDINIFPITRQMNILNAPKKITDVSQAAGAPFAFLKKGELVLSW